jgi:putative thioredoxin
MSTTDYIINASEADFEYEVVAYSQQIPVVVDFWAEWCGPCRMLGPILERLANEANGAFRLAKVNVDENSNLARRYNIRSIPAVKAFRNGLIVAEFMGALPEPRVREFVRGLAPSGSDLLIGKAYDLLKKKEWSNAESVFCEALQEDSQNSPARLGLIKSLLYQGRPAQAQDYLKDFPASKELVAAETLRPLVESLIWLKGNSGFSDDPLEAAYLNALRLVMRGNLPAAMDGILDILRQDKRYRNGEAHKIVLAIFEMLGEEDPLTQEYRNELSMILF